MYRFFPHLPFYTKFGAIPESYLIALSYEEQLLWLCKHIEELDEKIDSSFLELKNYIDEALRSIEGDFESLRNDMQLFSENVRLALNGKQDKLIPAKLVDFLEEDSKLYIRAYDGILTRGDNVNAGYGIPTNLQVGDTLPTEEVTHTGDFTLYIYNIKQGEKFHIKGHGVAYMYNPSTREIIQVLNYMEDSDIYTTFDIPVGGDMCLFFNSTVLYPYSISRVFNIPAILQAIDTGDNNTLVAGTMIGIYEASGNKTGIRGYDGDVVTGNITPYTYYPTNYNVGDTLGSPLASSEPTDFTTVIEDVQPYEKFNIRGFGVGYLINPDTSEILRVFDFNSVPTREYSGFSTVVDSGTLVLSFTDLNNYPSSILRVYNIDRLIQKDKDLDTKIDTKQDELTPINDIVFNYTPSDTYVENFPTALNMQSELDNNIGYSFPENWAVGDTVSLTPIQESDGTYCIIDNVRSGDIFYVKGFVDVALLNNANEVLYRSRIMSSSVTSYTVSLGINLSAKAVFYYHRIFDTDTTDVHGNAILYGYGLRQSYYNQFVKKSGDFMSGYLQGVTKIAINKEIADNALGTGSIATGLSNCSGDYSMALGNTQCSGDHSISVGTNNTTSGNEAMTVGSSNTASGYYSIALGRDCNASGDNSVAIGTGATAVNDLEIVLGDYNVPYDPNSMLPYTNKIVVGNGAYSSPSNSFTLTTAGDGWFSGDVYVGSTSGTDKDSGSKKLATEDYVNTQIGTISTALQNINTGTGV